MTPIDEILSLINHILNSAGNDGSALERWGQTEDGQKVIQFIQIGKYNTNIGEGKDISIGDGLDRSVLEEIRDLLQNQISPKQPDYAIWKIEQNKYFSDSLKSSRQSFAAFKQIIDIKSQYINFIKRQELFDRLDNCYSSWATAHQIFTVLGEEGDGKTWGVAYWL
jgi:Effector-associated domain 10